MVDQPQAPQALQTGGVTQFGEVLVVIGAFPGPIGRHRAPSPPPPNKKI